MSWWRALTLRDRLVIALVSTLIIVAKFYLRLPLHTPGHTGFFWMALLVVGVGVIRRPGAGTMIGLLTAILATIFLPGQQGVLVGVKYFVPGLVVDLLWFVFRGGFDRYAIAVVVGATANAAKLTASYLLGLLLGIPAGYLALGVGLAATTHVVFGALGGLIGAYVLRRLERAGIPNSSQAEEAASS
jgi:hypothetical protein